MYAECKKSRRIFFREQEGEFGRFVLPFTYNVLHGPVSPFKCMWLPVNPGDVVDGRDLVVHPGLFKRCEQVDNCYTDGSLSGHAFGIEDLL